MAIAAEDAKELRGSVNLYGYILKIHKMGPRARITQCTKCQLGLLPSGTNLQPQTALQNMRHKETQGR